MLFYNGEHHMIHILIIHKKKKNSVTHHNELAILYSCVYILHDFSATSCTINSECTLRHREQFVQELLEFSHDHFMLSLSLIIIVRCVTVLACIHFDSVSSTSHS